MLEVIAAAVIISLISKYALDYPCGLDKLSDSELQAKYNGVGSTRWPANKRDALSEAFEQYEICVVIHDVCQSMGIPAPVADQMLWRNLKRVWAVNNGIFRWFKKSARIERKVILPKLYEILTENRDRL